MTHTEHILTSADGLPLHYQSWYPEGAARAVALVIHGAAEHGGRYAEFASQLNSRGIAVATVDLPGHGRSGGKRCCVSGFDEYLGAVETAHAYAETESDNSVRSGGPDVPSESPPFLLVGHSMGGLVASLYLQKHQHRFAGAVFSGAALVAEPEPPALQVVIVRALANWFPTLGVLKLDAGGVSRDPEVVDRYVNDPLVYSGKLSSSMLVSMFEAMERSREGMAAITLPVLILHGEEDRLVPPSASRLLAEHVSSEDSTLKLLPGLYHEIFNEPERVGIVNDVIDWAEQRFLG